MALEIHATDAPRTFREFCGPADPEIARHLRPATLRALYGKNKVQNAVHCTDLPDDGILEVQYFFKILDGWSNRGKHLSSSYLNKDHLKDNNSVVCPFISS